MRTWNVERRKRKKGTYVVLRTRSREHGDAVLKLGYVSEEAAQRAKVTMNREEEAGTAHRILGYAEEEPDGAVAFLTGDAADQEAFSPTPAYGTWGLKRYFHEVFAPARADTVRGWRQERARWKQILADLGDVRVKDVDEWVVADYLERLRASTGPRAGMPLSGNAKRLRKACIQALLLHAYRQKHITALPELKVFQIKGSTRVVQQESEPLTLDELVELLEATDNPQHRAMWGVAAGEGLRPTEVLRLRWEGVDWRKKTLEVPPHEDGPGAGSGKTALSADRIPLTPLALQELRVFWVRQGQPGRGWMFPSPKTGQPYAGYNSLHRPLDKARKKAGIKRKVYPRLLRKSFATIAWSLGIDLDTTRRIMRHVDEKMLLRVYQRVRPSDLVALVEAFDFER
jgi:integrase